MKILHVATGLPKASGITTFVENLTNELIKCGHISDMCDVSIREYVEDIEKYDIVHLHGIWKPRIHKIAKKVLSLSKDGEVGPRLVWSPHGMLQLWALKNKWWKKLVALALYQWWDLRNAHMIHVTAQSEVEDVRRLGLKNKVVIAPLGMDVPKKNINNGAMRQMKTLLFVSRIQRKKGLPNLLEAWSQIDKSVKKDWRIRIVGPDEDNHIAELKAQAASLGVEDEVTFVGPLYGEQLALEYSVANVFVLPTHSENFGSVVIEALAHNVPVICTKEAPWEELETNKCGWWIDDNVAALVDALCSALGTPTSTLEEMGRRGRMLVESKYTWPAVARIMLNCYNELCHEN